VKNVKFTENLSDMGLKNSIIAYYSYKSAYRLTKTVKSQIIENED